MVNPTPPIATKKPHEITTHGHTRVDDYYWLREKTNEDMLDYLRAENAYTQALMAHTDELQKTLYEEMVGRIQETDEDVPVKKGNYYYYSRTVEGLQYSIRCRKLGSLDAEEEILLDLNKEVAEKGYEYVRLGVYEISPDHKILAYALDTTGQEFLTVYFKNLETGALLADEIPNTKYDGEWGNDNLTYFYVTQDDAQRDYALHRHTLGTPVAEDVLLYEELDEVYRIGIGKTRDDAYLILTTSSIESSEVYVLDANAPTGDFRLLQARQEKLLYYVDHREGLFYFLTNQNARNFKIITTPVATPTSEHWVEFVGHREDVLLQNFDLFENYFVLYKRENGLKNITVLDFRTNESHELDFPEAAYTYGVMGNPEYKTNLLRFVYMSLATPDTVYDYDMDTRELDVKKRKVVLGGYLPEDYVVERIHAQSHDGVQVPISLVYKKGLKKDGNAPCLLYGYGSYGFSMPPTFSSNRLSLLDRGVIFAIAHIRGGQEMGRYWYEDGKYLKKKNTFKDFIAAGQHLIANDYTRREKMAIQGGSAGGLLIGAVVNMAPDLCDVAIAQVPFVDVVTTMLDESIPLTVNEFEEWGNPKNKEYYEYMLSYSPYDNVEAKAYPHLLITAGLNDPRVQYWEPSKWLAKLRVTKTDSNRLLMKMNMGAGHHGATGRYDYLKEIAFEYAFLIDLLVE